MDIVTLALAKRFTRDTADALGAVKGAPCTVKSVVHQDGINKVTLEWTGTSGAKQETVVTIEVYMGVRKSLSVRRFVYLCKLFLSVHYGKL
ncbi:MAG: hypothetical protein IJ644_00605 [Oscillospiraceae bacterium]|nr:hypothetical protein [Oscillospiraceae bacterium]